MTSHRLQRTVIVEIFGGRYPVKSSLDEAYVKRIAQYVDRKMHAAADQMQGGDTLRVAVLTALNIADGHFRLLEGRTSGTDVRRAASELEKLIDSALVEDPPDAATATTPCSAASPQISRPSRRTERNRWPRPPPSPARTPTRPSISPRRTTA